jgi:hypothetical protein
MARIGVDSSLICTTNPSRARHLSRYGTAAEELYWASQPLRFCLCSTRLPRVSGDSVNDFVLREEQMSSSASHPRIDCTYPAAAALRHGLQYGSAEI